MSEQKPEKPELDPAAPMVQFFDAMMKSWAGAMSEMTTSKSFADSMSQQMQGNLEAVALMRRQASELMEQYLQQMSLPSRKEVLSLAERLTRIEMHLDDLEAKLDETLDGLKSLQAVDK
jgi:polyhydroxyalkanoate synthesis regulator phasin